MSHVLASTSEADEHRVLPVRISPLLDRYKNNSAFALAQEKDRLSRINEFGKGNVPVNLPPLGYGRNVPRGNLRSKQQRTPLEEFEQRFDEVIEEIAERESHLEEMGQLGGRTDDMATQVRAEIAERVRLLRRLDDRIKEMRAADDGAREGIVGGGGSGGAALPAARER